MNTVIIRRWLWVGGLLALLLLGGRSGQAQGGLDPDADPAYGVRTLAPGFLPDPLVVAMSSGGTVSAPQAVGAFCRGEAAGFVTAAPNYRLTYSGLTGRLRLFFVGRRDTTLIVQGPGGEWYCDDDSGGNGHPMLTFVMPRAGVYSVWVGSFEAGVFAPGALYITTQGGGLDADGQPLPVLTPLTEGAESVFEPGLDPTPAALNIGLSPRLPIGVVDGPAGDEGLPPIQIQSGGPVTLAGQGVPCAEGAVGYSQAAPDYRLYFRPTAGGRLRIFFVGAGDTTLVVNGPGAAWACSDDWAGGRNPLLEFQPEGADWYNIWVGSFAPAEFNRGDLIITTRDESPADYPDPLVPTPAPDGQGGGPLILPLSPDAEPSFGDVVLRAGFAPDPQVTVLASGGAVDVRAALGDLCPEPLEEIDGFAAHAPDYRVKYVPSGAEGERLRFFFVGQGQNDATLVVHAPDGTWRCSDDWAGLDPLIDFPQPVGGLYTIWVGGFERGDFVRGALYITGQVVNPLDYR